MHPAQCQTHPLVTNTSETQQLPTLFSVPSSELQISQTQDLNRSLFKKKYWYSPFELLSIKAAVTPPRCPLKGLEEPYRVPGAGADQLTAKKAHFPSSLSSSRRSSPTPTSFTYDSEEDVRGFEGLLHPRRVLLHRR